jgi:hypothetical protein
MKPLSGMLERIQGSLRCYVSLPGKPVTDTAVIYILVTLSGIHQAEKSKEMSCHVEEVQTVATQC